MNGHDEARLDTVAVYALGALPEPEAREIAAHVADCAICRREYDELRAAADALALSAEAAPAELGGEQGARMKARVMEAVRAGAALPESPARRSAPIALDAARARRRLPWGWPALAAAAAVIAIWAGFDDATLRAQGARQREQSAALSVRAETAERQAAQARAELALVNSRVADLVAPGGTRFPIAGGEVVRANDRIVIAVQHLPKLPQGKVYQAWTLRKGAKAMTPSSTFVPDASGLAVVELPDPARNLAAVAVSVEPEGGSKAPTSKPNFVRLLG